MQRVLPALLLLLMGGACAQSQQELFEKAFGSKPAAAPGPSELSLPVDLDQRELGQLSAQMEQERPARVRRTELWQLLDGISAASARETLASGPDWIDPQALGIDGLELQFDAGSLRFRLVLATELRQTQVLSLSRRAPSTQAALAPANFSIWSNLGLQAAYQHRGLAGGWQQRSLGWFGAARIYNWVYDFSSAWRPGSWTPGPWRVVRDRPESAQRFQFGDLAIPAQGLQLAPQMRGLAWASDESLQPRRSIQPSLLAPLVLQADASIDVLRNGISLQTLRLPAGRYELEDFPLLYGRNDVEILARDDQGGEQRSNFSTFYSNELLGLGQRRFYLALGRDQSDAAGATIYSAAWQQGLAPALTGGIGIQGQPAAGHHVLSTQWSTAYTPLGLDLQWAGSRAGTHGFGQAARLSLSSFAPPESNPHWRWELAASWRNDRWLPLQTRMPAGRGRELAARASRALSPADQLSVGLRLLDTERRGKAGTLQVQWQRRLARGVNLRLALEHQQRADGGSEQLLSVGFSMQFDRQQALRGDWSATGAAQLDWQWQPETTGTQRFFSSSAYTDASGNAGLDTAYSQSNDWTSVNLAHSTPLKGPGQPRSQLSADTALVFADGAFGLVERVTDSFAIFTPERPGQSVYIDPSEQRWLASSEGPGPAVVGTLTAYEPRGFVVQMPDWPIDEDPGELLPQILPAYHSGHRVRLGRAAGCRLRLQLLADGQPLQLEPGALLGPGLTSEIPVYADRTGTLETPPLQAGSYTLRMLRKAEWIVPLEAPTECTSTVDLGTRALP